MAPEEITAVTIAEHAVFPDSPDDPFAGVTRNGPLRCVFPEPISVKNGETLVVNHAIEFDENGVAVSMKYLSHEVIPADGPSPDHVVGVCPESSP